MNHDVRVKKKEVLNCKINTIYMYMYNPMLLDKLDTT